MRLINADKIIGFGKYIKTNSNFEPYIMIDDLVKVIDEQPTVKDVEQQNFDDMASAVGLFVAQCGEMAEKNWCNSQVVMLQRLFGAVLSGVEYEDYIPGDDE